LLIDIGKDILIITLMLILVYWPIAIVKIWFYLDRISPADLIQTAIFFILTLTVLVMHSKNRQDKEKEESEKYLDYAIRMGDEAHTILINKQGKLTSSRRSWVTSARLIKRSAKFSQLITLDSHKEIYESEIDILRHRFGMLLNMDVGQNQSFTFFAGDGFQDVWEKRRIIYEGIEKKMIPSSVFSTVIRFSTYPDTFEDPLDDVYDLTDEELRMIWIGGHKGIVRYIIFKRHFIIKFKSIRTDLPNKNNWQEVDIDQAKILLEQELDEIMPIVL